MDCEIPYRVRRRTKHSYQGVESSHDYTRFKNFKGKLEIESPKRTISYSSGLGPLQMVSDLDTGRYANKKVEPRKR